MTQPTPYYPNYSFTTYQTSHPSDPLPAASLDAELFNVATSIREICDNLALIQRDDGALANASVGADQLKSEIVIGVNPATLWLTGTAYVVNDSVWENNNLYLCKVSHTSTTFSTDLGLGYWSLILDTSSVVSAASGYATAAAASAAAASTSETNAATSETNAGVSETNAAASAAAAAASAAGMKWRPPVIATTTGALPSCTYNNGTSGVGATLTGSANGALAAQDGITLVLNDDLLVQNQATAAQNGVYTLTQVGDGTHPFILTRRADADTWAELVSMVVPVEEGSVNADYTFICTVDPGGTIGTTNVTWSSLKVIPVANSVQNSMLVAVADKTIKSNISGSSANPSDNTLTAIFDAIFGSTQGSIVYRNSTGWVILGPGTSGQFLKTNGASANPAWAALTVLAPDYQAFTSSGTWTKPAGFSSTARVLIECWGAGGGGGGAGSAGGNGGSSSVGTLITAYGGSGGSISTAAAGGAAGGYLATATAGSTTNDSVIEGVGMVDSFTITPSGGFYTGGGGGGGFSTATYKAGRNSVYGGGGGGGLSNGAGGSSVFAGNGGAAPSTAGSAPGGGGGGGNSNGGGGGGGSYKYRWVALSAMGATETVTVGAAGTAGTAPNAGNAGARGEVRVTVFPG